MTARLDASKFSADSANPIEVVFAKAIPLHNQMADLSDAYAAISNSDDAVAQMLESSDDPQIKDALAKRAKLEEQIAKLNATLHDYAVAKITETLGNGLTEDQIKKDHQDAGAALSEVTLGFRDMFQLMGHIKKVPAPEGKKREVFVSNGTEYGDLFVKLLNKPNLGNAAPTGEGKRVREWWANTEVKDSDGNVVTYQKQGKIPASVWDAYKKSHKDEVSDGE